MCTAWRTNLHKTEGKLNVSLSRANCAQLRLGTKLLSSVNCWWLLVLVHSLLLLGTFATSVSTSCYLALFLLPNWCCRGNSLPTHVTGFGQGSLGATRIGCRGKETDASIFRFKAVHNSGNLWSYVSRFNEHYLSKKNWCTSQKKNKNLQLTKQKHQEDQNEHQWFIGHRRKVTYLDFEWRACVAE